MYHSINTPPFDPWELAVSPEHFEQQLEVLKKFRVISPSALVEEVSRRNIHPNTVSLTFDDGYEDNFSLAKPLLEKYACPAMFFISTNYIGKKELFWWDELAALLLEPIHLPDRLSIDIAGKSFIYELNEDAVISEEKRRAQLSWVWHEVPPTKRCALYLEIWKLLRPLEYAAIKQVIESLYNWNNGQRVGVGNFAMSASQLKLLSNHPLIETGLHTSTHPALSNHDRRFQFNEIDECRSILKSSGQKAGIIAYPYGDFDDNTIDVAKELTLAGGFTTLERVITNKANILKMGRFQVRDVDGNTFEKQLIKWFSSFPVS